MDFLNKDYFVLPHIPHIPLKKVKKLKIFASKMQPLYLTCSVGIDHNRMERNEERKENHNKVDENQSDSNEEEIEVLFKKGDDLRKDQVVLQLLKIFNQLCLEDSLNLHLTAYTVLATGFKYGYLEFVGNKKDLVEIHRDHSSFTDCFFSQSLINNLKSITKQSKQLSKFL